MLHIEDTRLVRCLQPVVTHISIPEPVITIGKAAFAHHNSLTTVTLPDTLKTIGDEAFTGCTSLRDAGFPASLRRLIEHSSAQDT